MLWLVTQMGILLAVTALLGTFFGWGFRGLRLKGGARRAMVERDVALTELEQTRSELDKLYAAQRSGIGAAEDAGDQALRAELEAREGKVQSLSAELAASQAELEKLRDLGTAGAAATAVGAAAIGGALAGVSDERLDTQINQASAELEWRNRYLESRVRSLETQIGTQATDLADQAARVEALEAELAKPQPIETEAAIVSEVSASPDTDKIKWQNAYLRRRLAFLETSPPRERADALSETPPAAEASEAGSVVRVERETVVPEEAEAAGDVEQELARLRWRNRYLEGRLAYIDGDAERGEDKTDSASEVQQSETVSEAPVSSPVDAFLATVESEGALVKPEMIPHPEDDGDDLTQISGIGADLKAVLNDLGVWRFSQIAAWTPQNIAWVDAHLSDMDDLDHNDWVQQADVLANGGGLA